MLLTTTETSLAVEMIRRSEWLPAEWDARCGTFLRSTRMLAHYERHNPCGQRYYAMFRNGELVAGAIVYTRIQNLLTFLGNIHSPVSVNIVGVPASISPAGIWGASGDAADLLNVVFRRENGLTLVLNLPLDFPKTHAHETRLLPGMVLASRLGSLAEYEAALRASWRRRLRKTRKKFADVLTVREGCSAFTCRHHALYLEVLARSPEKMETLGFTFFQALPEPIELVSCYHGTDLLCWRLVLGEGDRFWFLLGGHDYRLNHLYDAYFNNLIGVLADGLAHGASHIDFGQTTEDPKARLGAKPLDEKMLLYHSGSLRHQLMGLAAPLLAYRKTSPVYHLFKNKGLDHENPAG